MTRYTFEIQWPLPFKQGWQKSSQKFMTTKLAAIALADFLEISADNGCFLEGRLVILPNDPDE